MPSASGMAAVSFSHVHMYCDSLKELEEYKQLEQKLNSFVEKAGPAARASGSRQGADVAEGRSKWLELSGTVGNPVTGEKDPSKWTPSRQDVVEQMLVGLGWRITGVCQKGDTRTFVITSKDPSGVKFVVTAHNKLDMQALGERPDAEGQPEAKRPKAEAADHFSAAHLARFSRHRAGREGVAVLGFAVAEGGVARIRDKYAELHPKLLVEGTPREHPGAKILEVYAYYKGEKRASDADPGTVLRFVEQVSSDGTFCVLPGVDKVDAAFEQTSHAAYCDHWVSNVVSREGFLDTLNDTLGFSPKVDFNAGVVAAGEAQIESTVIGNEPGTKLDGFQAALQDQSQVYLPINNALSEVGHVHLYLKEIGQGVQHIASRVADLPALVQRANDFRKMTGAGLSFLSIPRSYYGSLTAKSLSKAADIDLEAAERYVAALRDAGIVDKSDIVDLDVAREKAQAALPKDADPALVDHVLRARYSNLYALLRDHIGEETYMRIVRNNILVDVQGEDLLMQIFTNTVLQRAPGEEAPFLEFIQRVCSEKTDDRTGQPKAMKPGCGGFGIRNFLTLFLSIEVSKATKARADAEAMGKQALAAYYGKMVEAFTSQLDESNPVLTAISDAMTAEGEALERGDAAAAARCSAEKAKGQEALQTISTKFKGMMRDLRQGAPAGA